MIGKKIKKVTWGRTNLRNKSKDRDSSFLEMFSSSKAYRAIMASKNVFFSPLWNPAQSMTVILRSHITVLSTYCQLIVQSSSCRQIYDFCKVWAWNFEWMIQWPPPGHIKQSWKRFVGPVISGNLLTLVTSNLRCFVTKLGFVNTL